MELGIETVMIRYLLGELSDTEESLFEERYFSDDQIFGKLQIVETELIDSYVRGELPDVERERFETYYLSSRERRERVELARSLAECIAREAPALSAVTGTIKESMWHSIRVLLSTVYSPMRLAYAGTAVAILVFGSVTLVHNERLRSELRRVQTEQANLLKHDHDLQEQIAKLSGAPSGHGASDSRQEIAQLQPSPIVASITLTQSLTRSPEAGTSNSLIVPGSARLVVLNLSVEGEESRTGYSAEIETARGSKVCRFDRLRIQVDKAGNKSVVLPLAAELFGNDGYIVNLTRRAPDGTTEEVGSYSFEVRKR